MAIEGPSKAEISCIDNKDGTCTVTYLPTLPGDYSILVKYNDMHIAGSPFIAKVTGKVYITLYSIYSFKLMKEKD